MLKDKIAVITGGSRGIGFATAKKFLENGAKVILLASRKETADAAVEKLKSENDAWEVTGMWPDLGNFAEVEEAFLEIVNTYGRIDILVNNAGISDRSSLYDYKAEDFKKIMELNVDAVFYCSKAAAVQMKKQGGGVILNTSSMVSIYGQPSGCGYPASKFAVNGMTKSMARELGKDGIRVNAVAPGVTMTDMVAAVPEAMLKPIIDTIPLKRIGTPEEVANAFLFLASDMASYITGVVLSVDGAAMN